MPAVQREIPDHAYDFRGGKHSPFVAQTTLPRLPRQGAQIRTITDPVTKGMTVYSVIAQIPTGPFHARQKPPAVRYPARPKQEFSSKFVAIVTIPSER
jgi:hypothetical protein